jgi:hypothetical protein
MGRESKKLRHARVHELALRRFNEISSATNDDRLQSRTDRRFVDIAGAQWEGPLGQQFANKPRFEVNKILGAINRLEAEHRNNRHSVDYMPADGSASDAFADALDSLFRSDEQDSNADEAYDNAYSEGIRGGIGAARLRAVSADPDDEECEHQRISIEPITDADTSVYFDLNSKRFDKSDAQYVFVVTPMTHDSYKETYNDDPASWPKAVPLANDWCTPDVVYVAEYLCVEYKSMNTYTFKGLAGDEKVLTDEDLEVDDDDDEGEEGEPKMSERERIEALGYRLIKEKKKKKRVVHKWIMSGGGILEDCKLIAGPNLTVVPYYGRRVFVDNKERWCGHVRPAMDMQRVNNMLISRLAEISALSTVAKPVFDPEEINDFAYEWQTDNIENRAFLHKRTMLTMEGQPIMKQMEYTRPPDVPPALAGLLQVVMTDIKDVLGNQEQKEKVVSNISGTAVEMFQQSLDLQAYVYLDNYKKFIRRIGEVWLGMAAEIYVEDDRVMKLVGPDGQRSSIKLGQPTMGAEGEVFVDGVVDWARAKMDVVVEVGPSSATRKSATVRALTALLTVVPESDQSTRTILTSAALANMEGEGLGDINKYFRKQLVRAGVTQPTQKEAEMLEAEAKQKGQNQDPQALAMLAMAQKEQALAEKAKADTVKALAGAGLVQAQTEKAKAEALQTIVEIDRSTAGGMPRPPDQE